MKLRRPYKDCSIWISLNHFQIPMTMIARTTCPMVQLTIRQQQQAPTMFPIAKASWVRKVTARIKYQMVQNQALRAAIRMKLLDLKAILIANMRKSWGRLANKKRKTLLSSVPRKSFKKLNQKTFKIWSSSVRFYISASLNFRRSTKVNSLAVVHQSSLRKAGKNWVTTTNYWKELWKYCIIDWVRLGTNRRTQRQ